MLKNYLDRIELQLFQELYPRARIRSGATPTIKKACRVVDIHRAPFRSRVVRMDAATAHEFRRACVQRQLNIAPGLDQVFSLWAGRPAEAVARSVLEGAPLDPVLSTVQDSFGAKVHPVAWGAMFDRARSDGLSFDDSVRAAVRYWVAQPKSDGESAARVMREGGLKVSEVEGQNGPGRPMRQTAVVPLMVHLESPLAGRLRRYASRYGVKQREILHQALEEWLRRQHYAPGDPDAGGPIGREIEPLEAPTIAQDNPTAGTSGENPASQAPPVDLL